MLPQLPSNRRFKELLQRKHTPKNKVCHLIDIYLYSDRPKEKGRLILSRLSYCTHSTHHKGYPSVVDSESPPPRLSLRLLESEER